MKTFARAVFAQALSEMVVIPEEAEAATIRRIKEHVNTLSNSELVQLIDRSMQSVMREEELKAAPVPPPNRRS